MAQKLLAPILNGEMEWVYEEADQLFLQKRRKKRSDTRSLKIFI